MAADGTTTIPIIGIALDGDDPKAVKAEDRRRNIAEERESHKKDDEEALENEKKRDGMTRILGLIYDAVAGAFEGTQPTVDVADGSYRRISPGENEEPFSAQLVLLRELAELS